jgi:hypothetical protein
MELYCGEEQKQALTFMNRASCVLYIGQAHCYPPNTPFYIFFQQIYVLNFLNMLHTLRFSLSSKCRLFHNSTYYGSCIIHMLHTGYAEI